jgi:hypothetical protein
MEEKTLLPDLIFTCWRCLGAHGAQRLSHRVRNTMSRYSMQQKTDKRQHQMMQPTACFVSRHRGIYGMQVPASLSPSSFHVNVIAGSSLPEATADPPFSGHCDKVNITPMAPFFLALVLAASAAARGITEAPSAITPAAQADCPLTNSIPSCGVSRLRSCLGSISVTVETDGVPDRMSYLGWRCCRLLQPVRSRLSVQSCVTDSLPRQPLRYEVVRSIAWVFTRVGSCRHLHPMRCLAATLGRLLRFKPVGFWSLSSVKSTLCRLASPFGLKHSFSTFGMFPVGKRRNKTRHWKGT